MNHTRIYFLLTAISGMIGMISLIATNLLKTWTFNADITKLSDKGVDQLHFLSGGLLVSFIVSIIAATSFIVFLIFYLVSKNRNMRSE